jgi:hypothetical protein
LSIVFWKDFAMCIHRCAPGFDQVIFFLHTFCCFSWLIATCWFKQQASDDEDAKEEEKIAKQIQRKRTTFFTEEEYELADIREDKVSSAYYLDGMCCLGMVIFHIFGWKTFGREEW